MPKPTPPLRISLMPRAARCFLLCLFPALLACSPADSGLQLGEERLSPKEAENTAAMIAAIEAASLLRYPTGTVRRFNQSKTLGCFDASFTVAENLDPDLQQGIFVPGARYTAQLRFANATEEDDLDKDFRGLSIKLHDVAGTPLWGAAGMQDFLLNSYPALFAANPADFLDFINATRDGKLWRYFINPAHFYSLSVVLRGRAKIDNPFAIQYWSTTPYRYGSDAASAVKYSVRPCDSAAPAITVARHPDFLRDAMQEQLRQRGACFDFMVQFQTDPDSMPIENAAVIWDEAKSPFITVAKIRIDNASTSAATEENCEAMRFNPWQSIAAHQPLGGINRTRKPIYAEIGEFRDQQNRLRTQH
jgi:catalase